LGVALDYRFNGVNDITPATSDTSNWAYAVALYASYQATEKLTLHTRVDYTTGSDGTWFDAGLLDESDKQNRLGSLTVTADYSLWANVLSRLELRWDRSLTSDEPYNDGRSKNAVTLAANLIYNF
jgi:predicted porin